MAIIKCKHGHYYDTANNSKCPFCNTAEELDDFQKTIRQLPDEHPESYHMINPYRLAEQEMTVSIFSPKNGNDFVVGWLVCIKGPDKGRDYRLHHGFNRIGRDYKNDVVLENDKSVSRGPHCSVVYEDKTNTFYLRPEKGQLTYYEGTFVDEPIRLFSRDVFEIGGTMLEFVAFCEGSKKWEV